MSVFITGSSGFVGKSFIASFSDKKSIPWKRGDEINIDAALVVIHLAGKAHDLKKASNADEYYQFNTELTKTVFDAFLGRVFGLFGSRPPATCFAT
jgi:nucleoside-diphosphate-sugar epimerase